MSHGSSSLLRKCRLLLRFRFLFNPNQYNFIRQCDLVLDAAHRKSPEPSIAPKKEDIVESIIFKASDVVVVTFKDVDLNFARKGTEDVCDYIIFGST